MRHPTITPPSSVDYPITVEEEEPTTDPEPETNRLPWHKPEPLTPRRPFDTIRSKVNAFFGTTYSNVSPRITPKRNTILRQADRHEKELKAELAAQRHHDLLRQSNLERLQREHIAAPYWQLNAEQLIGDSEVIRLTYNQLILAAADWKIRRNHDARCRYHQTLTVLVGMAGKEVAENLAIESGIANDLPFPVFSDLMVGNWLT